MKFASMGILSLILTVFVTIHAAAQSQISAAPGQNIVFVADSVRTNTTLKFTNGILKIAGDRYLWANPNDSNSNVIVGKKCGNTTMLGIRKTFLGGSAGT
jgi:hypothetical protein